MSGRPFHRPARKVVGTKQINIAPEALSWTAQEMDGQTYVSKQQAHQFADWSSNNKACLLQFSSCAQNEYRHVKVYHWSSSGPLNFNPSSSMAFSIGSVLNIGVFAATARRHEYGRAGEIPTGRIWLLSRLRVASTIPQENHMRINASTSHGKSFASFHCGEQLICA
ncbi:hypothetical protein CIRG_00342 [Coccidioides immitis RMSCC 2394]|uniref:Uncharacterized protein n=1 Tax=Coccidioides immitis RMSCC 2394 TaxID=404692 RepID=A0A0J6XXN8_COCIT|nr:hypothetical protein CIRG_00342 [Coccidioides immitis RMSCC 2394]